MLPPTAFSTKATILSINEWMPISAMSQRRVHSRETFTAQNILTMSDCFEMFRIYALMIAA